MTDPLAPVSGQFALAGSTGTIDAGAMPSPDGARPWGLRRTHPARPVPVSGEQPGAFEFPGTLSATERQWATTES